MIIDDGSRMQPMFTTEALDAIYAHTHGICREINNICTATLLDAVLRKDKLIDLAPHQNQARSTGFN
ncbi:hypothetical protein [Paenibacillus nasutitermitis]|uniref:Uncharacterized protein n=1 Tax=Paenibacillus nasutitermitis TaxID=1652958 RepID=A0A917DP04_9BACL|nr:hypothetical protein [Paenibacillus nasutitermitis]GGD52810.1 hypothetical protein GCM10010911_07960 [Paenibacillus nasutitermitis]